MRHAGSKRALPLGLFLAVIAVAVPAGATSFHEDFTYYVRYHFNATAWDKPVAAVYVHTGVLVQASVPRGGQYFWEAVQHFPLALKDGHFFGKAMLRAYSAYEYQYVQGPRVQYWVYFRDGSSIVTEAYAIPAQRGNDQTRLEKAYLDASDSDATWCDFYSHATIS